MNLVIAFIGGMFFMWFVGYRLLNLVYGKGKNLKNVLKNLNPDAFKRLRDAVDAEKERRASL